MTSHSDDTKFFRRCEKCAFSTWDEDAWERHETYHKVLSAESGGTQQASESEGQT